MYCTAHVQHHLILLAFPIHRHATGYLRWQIEYELVDSVCQSREN